MAGVPKIRNHVSRKCGTKLKKGKIILSKSIKATEGDIAETLTKLIRSILI